VAGVMVAISFSHNFMAWSAGALVSFFTAGLLSAIIAFLTFRLQDETGLEIIAEIRNPG
jgi:hypothetical protein